MRAEVIYETKLIEEEPLIGEIVKDPKIGRRDVLIKIKACGVCYSNLHMIEGHWPGFPSKLPIIPGHEISGVIEDVGGDVETWQVGQRVGIGCLYDACGRCEYCLTGREHLCLEQKITGETVDGGYAEFISAPQDFIYHVPENLGFEEAAPLFCPGVTAFRAVKRAGVRSGMKTAIFGVGGVGHMSVQFAKLAGAEITAVDISESKSNLALESGADYFVLADDFEKLDKFDVVMVHTPSQKAVLQASKSVKRGGTLLMAVPGELSIDNSQEYTIETSVIGPRMDQLKVLELASKGKVKVKWLGFQLDEANEVLLKLKRGEIIGRAVLTP